MKHTRHLIFRTLLLFLLLAGVWLAAAAVPWPAGWRLGQGLVFAAFTAVLFYVLLRDQLRQWEKETIERTQAEASRDANREKLRAIFDAEPDCLKLLEPDGTLCEINQAGLQMIEADRPAGIVGKSALSLVAPAYREAFRAMLATVARGEKASLEFQMIGFKGRTYWLDIHAVPVCEPGTGRTLILAVSRDITRRKQLETEVRLREARLNAFFDNAPVGLVLLDPQWRYVQINDSVARINGVAYEQHLGRTIHEVLPQFAPVIEPYLRQVLATGQPMLNVELVGEKPDQPGIRQHLLESFFPLFGKDGRTEAIGVIFVDITEQKRAAEALRESERKFAKIFESSPMAMTVSTMDEGRYLDVNREFLRMLGRSREEVIGHTSVELGIWTDRTHRTREIARARDTGTVRNLELEIRHQSGEAIHILWSAEPVVIGGERCLLGSSLDITERKRAKDELRWKTAFLEAQVDSALDGILVVDNQGRRLLQNRRLLEIWKIPLELAGNPEYRLQLEYCATLTKNPPAFLDKVASLYAHPDLVSRDEIELTDGTILDRYSSGVRDQDGRYYGRIWTFRDITDRRKLEAQFRQSQKMEAFGQLASGVAHDFNNILGVIQLQAGLLKAEQPAAGGAYDHAGAIEKAAQRAANLTRQLLLFSRQQAMQPDDLNLNEVVANLTQMLQRTLGERVRLAFKFSEPPNFIHADAGMIDQILLNLVVNARDAMPKGGQILIETQPVDFAEATLPPLSPARPGAFVCLSVTDTGSGIPPEIKARIFEPFFTTKEVGKGTGLGLATVFGIVQQHQGWINVYSEVGRGTTFRVYLPRLDQAPAPSAGVANSAPVRGGDETILLVEDEPALRLAVRTALVRLGYSVREATTGPEALAIWKQHAGEIRLLLTDLVMPGGMSGQELADQLREQNPGLAVVYASGYSAEMAANDFPLEEGVNFLTKPFESAKLARIVRQRLDETKR